MRRTLAVLALIAANACATPSAEPLAAPRTLEPETAPGVRLHVEVYGDGPQVVIAPGRLFMAEEMRALAAPDRTLVLYDMRNRGASSRVEDAATITILEDVRDLEAIRAHLRAERVSLIGYSYLGLMVALYAGEHPTRVERLVQLGPLARQWDEFPRPGLDSSSPEGRAAMQRAEQATQDPQIAGDQRALCRAQREALAYMLVGDPANAARVPDTCVYENERPAALERHFGAHFADLQRRTFAAERFAALTQPTLVIHGTLDRNAAYAGGRQWAQTIPDSRLITIEGGAHNVWLDDAGVVRDIDAFLRGDWPARAAEID